MPNGFSDTFVLTLLLQSIASTILRSITVRAQEVADVSVEGSNVVLGQIFQSTNALAQLINSRADQQNAHNTTIINKIVNETRIAKTAILSDIESSTLRVIGTDNTNTNNVITVLGQAISNQTTSVNQFTNDALNPIINTLGLILGQVGAAQSIPDIQIDNNIDVINDIINEITFAPVNEIQNTVVLEGSLFTGIVETVGTIFAEQQTANNSIVGSILDVVVSVLGDFGQAILDADDPLLAPLADIVEAILHNKDINTGILKEVLNDEDNGLGALVFRSISSALKKQLRISADDLREAAGDVFGPEGATTLDLLCIGDDFLTKADGAGRDDEVYEYVASFLALLGLPLSLSSAKAAACLAIWSEDHPWKLVEVGDAARMKHLGLLTESETLRIIQRSGYGLGDANNLLNAAQELPTIGELLTLWLRNVLDDEGINFALSQHGINETYIAGLKELAFFIPPVQDLVTMAVREVFSIEQATAQGQFEEFPEDFAKHAKEQGVSEIWAERYWAAHWILPSIQMGFEMLQRDVITRPELESLMKALDIMPFWRDRLIQISFSPFTRVDIRRMNATGVLDEDQVLRAYKDIGYDSVKAATLTEFTLKLNEDEEILDLDIASDLTRSNIVAFYVDGIITRPASFLLLIQAGINAAAAELFLQDADFKIERKERKQQVNIIIDRFKAGSITFVQADDQLRGLGLQTEELSLAQLDLARVKEQLTAIPSRADLDKFITKKIINDEQYLNSMELLGYSDAWSRRYLEVARG